jgi:hypothetical protein
MTDRRLRMKLFKRYYLLHIRHGGELAVPEDGSLKERTPGITGSENL